MKSIYTTKTIDLYFSQDELRVSSDIRISHEVDTIYLKYITVKSSDGNFINSIITLDSNLIPGSSRLVTLPDVTAIYQAVDIPFKCNNGHVVGTYDFWLDEPPALASGYYISLTFIFST